MKPILIASALVFSLSTSYAQEAENKSTSPLKVSEDQSSTQKSYDISIGYIFDNLKFNDGSELEGNGFGINAGKIFDLGKGLSTTTSVLASSSSLDENGMEIENGSNNINDIGLSQKLTYNIERNGVIFKPFIEAGLTRGNLNVERNFDQDSFSGSVEADFGYGRYTAALGVQFAFPNGYTPFIKYSISKLYFDSTAEVKNNLNGQSRTEEILLDDSDNQKLDTNTLTVGIGYLF